MSARRSRLARQQTRVLLTLAMFVALAVGFSLFQNGQLLWSISVFERRRNFSAMRIRRSYYVSSTALNSDLPTTTRTRGDTNKKTNSPADSKPQVPTIKEILAFAIPAIGIWLCSPLMSIVDTATTGLISGTAQQAALNPAVAVTDYSAQCMTFLYTVTMHWIAVAQEQDEGSSLEGNGQQRTKSALVAALRLSMRVGIVSMDQINNLWNGPFKVHDWKCGQCRWGDTGSGAKVRLDLITQHACSSHD